MFKIPSLGIEDSPELAPKNFNYRNDHADVLPSRTVGCGTLPEDVGMASHFPARRLGAVHGARGVSRRQKGRPEGDDLKKYNIS